MKIFAISDLHLSTAVQKPMDIFGNGWENHFEKISEDWAAKVSDSDLVLLGGDISWGLTIEQAAPDYRLIGELPGTKIVGKGNHDYYWTSLSKMQANFKRFNFLQNNAYRVEEGQAPYCFAKADKRRNKISQANDGETSIDAEKPKKGVVIAGSRGWNIPTAGSAEDKKIYSRELQRLELSLMSAKQLQLEGDKLVAMLHFPPFDADYKDTLTTTLLEKYGVDCVLYGHLHGKGVRLKPCLVKNGIKYLLTSCDLINYQLVQVDEV